MSIRILALLILTLSVISAAAWSAAPSSFNYAGQVSVNGVPFEGNGLFKFALVNFDCTEAPTAVASNCQTVWSNDGSSLKGGTPGSSIKLIVANGKFSVNIGDTNIVGMAALDPAEMQQQLYLRTWFDDVKNGNELLTPDNTLNSVPFAFVAEAAWNAVGHKQSWQEMGSIRGLGTVYQNDTGRPIVINVTCRNLNGPTSFWIKVENTNPPTVIADFHVLEGSAAGSVDAVIPSGHYYLVVAERGGTIQHYWSELR